MGLRKKQTADQSAETGPSPYDIGFKGSVEDINQADKAAHADIEAKRVAHVEYARKSDNGMSLRHSLDKHWALRDAFHAAEKVPFEIHQQLQQGAFNAFLEGRPENLQEILARPEEFLAQYQSEEKLVTSMLIQLADRVSDSRVPLLALANVEEGKRQEMLDNALHVLVSNGYNNMEKISSVLLSAGANAGHGSSKTLAAAISNGSTAVIEMLQEKGASFDEAVQTMRTNPRQYGNNADRLEFLEYRKKAEATIKELKETIKELTAKQKKEDPASPAPAETTASATSTKYDRLRRLAASPQ